MDYYHELMLKRNTSQLVLSVLFLLFLVVPAKIPGSIANLVDTTGGKIATVITAIVLCIYANPILGVLALLTGYELLRRSSIVNGSYALQLYYPTEEKKWSPFSAENQFPYTLEQEMVKKMTPQRYSNLVRKPVSFKPFLDNTHNAASVH